jgi:glycosyltransferase involved in cell wall biosynthesis
MRIAMIVPGVGGFRSTGHERTIPVLQALIERLSRGHTVLVVTLDEEHQRRYDSLGATVIALGRLTGPGRTGRYLMGFRRLISALRSDGGQFDVVHAVWADRSASWAVAAGRLLRIPVVVSVSGGELARLPDIGYGGQCSWLNRMGTSWALRAAHAVSSPSRYALAPLAQKRPDAVWLPWSVDCSFFEGMVERPLGPPWRLLHVASINRVKDQSTLLSAVRLVRDRGVAVELDCIGEDTLNGALERKAIELKLAKTVRFHGYKPLDALIPFYGQAHLYLQSSLHESMGAAVLEAAAAGVPTVGTAVGLVAEMAPEAAVAVPVRDPAALAEGILSLLTDEQRRMELARCARQFARTYDADWTAARLEALYAGIKQEAR